MTEQSYVDERHIQQGQEQDPQHDGIHINGAAAVEDGRRMEREVEPRDDEDEERDGQKREQRVDGRDARAAPLSVASTTKMSTSRADSALMASKRPPGRRR